VGHQSGTGGNVSSLFFINPYKNDDDTSYTCTCDKHFSKDVRLPVQLQRAMAAEAEAAREARAKVIAAEGEQKASRALREASEVISDSPAALQLRYLQVYMIFLCYTVYISYRNIIKFQLIICVRYNYF